MTDITVAAADHLKHFSPQRQRQLTQICVWKPEEHIELKGINGMDTDYREQRKDKGVLKDEGEMLFQM